MRKQYVPEKTMKPESTVIKGSFPLSKELQQAVADKHYLHRPWIRLSRRGDPSMHDIYKSRAKNKRLIRQARKKYEKSIATNAKANP